MLGAIVESFRGVVSDARLALCPYTYRARPPQIVVEFDVYVLFCEQWFNSSKLNYACLRRINILIDVGVLIWWVIMFV